LLVDCGWSTAAGSITRSWIARFGTALIPGVPSKI
jgi:hypothetical protein